MQAEVYCPLLLFFAPYGWAGDLLAVKQKFPEYNPWADEAHYLGKGFHVEEKTPKSNIGGDQDNERINSSGFPLATSATEVNKSACVEAQTIEIYDLEKRNINSSCETGMISEMDRYVLYADVDLTYGSDRWFKTIVFEIRNPDSSQFNRLCLLNLEYGCHDSYCYCEKKPPTKQTTFGIIINITTYVENSEAEIRGILTTVSRKRMYSNTVKLPVIYDLSKRVLQANNLAISPSQSSYKLKQTDRRLEFCCLNTPSPCVTTVVANHSVTTSGDRCTVIDVPPDASYDNVTVVTTVCHNHNFTRVIMLETEDVASTKIQPDDTKTEETPAIDVNIDILLVITLILFVFTLGVINAYRERKKFKQYTLLRKTDGKKSKENFITEYKTEIQFSETSDSEEPLMKSIQLATRPRNGMSGPGNILTTLGNVTANTTITKPEDTCAA